MEKKTKVYFAHSKLIYNTPLEKRLIKIMESAGLEVLDPNTQLGELGDIKPYLAAIDTCDAVICHPYGGYVGKGVYEELKHGIKNHKPCHKIIDTKNCTLNLVTINGVRVYEITDWKYKYGKIIY